MSGGSRGLHWWLAVCSVAGLCWTGVAHAQSAPRAKPGARHNAREPPRTRSYATPLAATYAISMGTDAALWAVALSIHDGQSGLLSAPYIALPATWIAPAIVHWAHGELGRGFLALGASAGSFTLGALPAAYLAFGYHPFSIRNLIVASLGVGFLFQAVWAYDDVENRSTQRVRVDSGATALKPGIPRFWATQVPGGAVLGLEGTL